MDIWGIDIWGIDIWNWVAIITKFALYASILLAVGTLYYRILFETTASKARLNSEWLILVFAGIGIIASLLSYVIRATNLTGNMAGMIDPEILGLLWQTPVGVVLTLRVAGLGLIIVALYLAKFDPLKFGRGPRILRFASIIGGLIALSSFSQIGHSSNVSLIFLGVPVPMPIASLVLTLHLLAVALWVGVLLPLYMLSADASRSPSNHVANHADTAIIAEKFGKMAAIFVPILLIAGGLLALLLLGSPLKLFTTSYGQILGLKILAVTALLGLAGINKLRLVPKIRTGNDAEKTRAMAHLRTSVMVEMGLVGAILLLTAILTST